MHVVIYICLVESTEQRKVSSATKLSVGIDHLERVKIHPKFNSRPMLVRIVQKLMHFPEIVDGFAQNIVMQ